MIAALHAILQLIGAVVVGAVLGSFVWGFALEVRRQLRVRRAQCELPRDGAMHHLDGPVINVPARSPQEAMRRVLQHQGPRRLANPKVWE